MYEIECATLKVSCVNREAVFVELWMELQIAPKIASRLSVSVIEVVNQG